MKRKSDISSRIGMIMLLMCAALVFTVLPVAADYLADKPLTEYGKGIITGEMNYTIGDSYYGPKMWSNNTSADNVYKTTILEAIPSSSFDVKARLYVYSTWSYFGNNNTGVNPVMNVTLNGVPLTLDAAYTDRKGYGTYDYPSGTYCYNVAPDLVSPGGVKSYVVNVTNAFGSNYNQSFNIQAVGLLTLYNYTSSEKQYWIDEGCDLTLPNVSIPPSLATTRANFSGIDNSNLESATLTTAVPAGGTVNNTLYFNNQVVANGVWDGSPRDPNFSYNCTEVGSFIQGINDWAAIRNGISDSDYNTTDGQMQAANAFLLVRDRA
jgi:hypothetical protein